MSTLRLLRDARLVEPSLVGAATPSRPPGPNEPTDVLVGGGVILHIAARIELGGVPHEVVDLAGREVIPGLVDAHVHLTGGGGEAGFRTRVPRVVLGQLVASGVTTAIGVLGTDGVTRTMRELVATTLALREEGLSAWCYTGNYAVPVVTLTGSVKDDVCFVEPILGVGELALSDHRSSQPTFDELVRIVSDAYVAGLTANKAGLTHLHLGDGPRGLELVARALATTELPARLFHPTHLNRNPRLWDEARAFARDARTAPAPRLPWFDVTAFPAEDGDDDPATVPAAAAWLGWANEGLPLDRLTMSSDGGGCLPTFDADGCMVRMDVGTPSTLLDAVRALLAAGVPLAQAITPVTANPARALQLDRPERGMKGHLAVGGDADLVVLEAGRPWAVMARGQWMMKDGALTTRGTFEPPAERGSTP